MIYKLSFDMERIDSAIIEGTNTIFAEKSNLNEIEYPGIKKGFFTNTIFYREANEILDWPNIEFYYSSLASNLESEYLLNASRWPIVHKKVQEEFTRQQIEGIQYLPINLIDVVTNNVNKNYVVMNILNFIDAIDLEKSEFIYIEKYDAYSFLPHATYLDKEICRNYDIFRAIKSPEAVYVSQKVKNIIEENNWVGFDFYRQKTN